MRTQEDVDNFTANYPGCTELIGPLNIAYDNSGITNLQGLSGIEIVHGDFYIVNQTELLDLSPLENLRVVNGFMGISESGVTEIAFNNLDTIEEGLTIRNNPNLRIVDGFNNLDSLGRTLAITYNENLEEIFGFENLRFAGEALRILENPLLREINAFSELDYIDQELWFAENLELRTLAGFEKLRYIGDYFIFRGTIAPISLTGFNALETVNGSFRIRENFGLEKVDGFQLLDTIQTFYEVINNPNLETYEGFNSLKSVGEEMRFDGNESLKTITGFKSLIEVGKRLDFINNDSLQYVDGFRNLERTGAGFVLLENFELEEFPPLISLQELGGTTQIKSNPKIQNLDGFSSLRSINGQLLIQRNDNLLNLDGLSNLESLGGSLRIEINAALRNIRGIANIDPRTMDDDFSNDLIIRFNPNLSVCSYKSVCDLFLLPDYNHNIGENGVGCSSEDEILCTERGILGTVFYDQNENGIRDVNEFGIPNQGIQITPTGERILTYFDGGYSIFLDFNTPYEIMWEQDPEWRLTTGNPTETITLQLDSLDNDRFDFGIVPVGPLEGGNTHFYQRELLCNDTTMIALIAQNLGTDFLEGAIELNYDEQFQYESAEPAPDQIDLVERKLQWNLNSLDPFELLDFEVRLLNPDELSLGDTVVNSAQLLGGSNNSELLDEHVFSDIVLCAYDPNDKLVNPIGEGEEGFILPDTPLDYTIRFQNTGNFPARNVSILDTIDTQLDLGTFEVTNSSFEVQTVLRGNIVEFRFNDIYLVDSIANEPESHGFVSFKIDPLEGLPDPTVVENTAHIFFDQNPAIVTNTARITYKTPMINSIHGSSIEESFYLYPNPTAHKIFISPRNQSSLNLSSYEIRSVAGQVLVQHKIKLENQSKRIHEVDVILLDPGIYFLILQSDGVQSTSKFVKM